MAPAEVVLRPGKAASPAMDLVNTEFGCAPSTLAARTLQL
jgi:hypothetical protein